MKNKMPSRFPSITVIIATYNSEKTIKECLKSVRSQDYPQVKIDILLADGGSTDNTLRIARKFNVNIVPVPPELQNAEYNKGIAVRKATGELLLMIDHDNVLPHDSWLINMVRPLLVEKDVVGVETLRYKYNPKGYLLDRYFALFGGDPFSFYLGKLDRLAYLYAEYNLLGSAIDRGSYYIVNFKPNKIPTLGANGFLIRKNILMKHALVDENHFFHIDVNVDLIKKGFNTYAFIKDDILHLTGYKNLSSFLYRRKLFMEQYYTKNMNRRYSVFMSSDKLRLLIFIIYSITFIKPTLDALRGYTKIRDFAWFLHPLLCFTLFSIYSFVVIKSFIKKYV
ncbi:MAG: hypothetical protein A3H79_03260 [Candidatus Levybacteria bacterium RIFCSPLOWO2_02_FULL_36_8b]|nr:MAG: hypothetical protein A3H79_03260 [Candidatus Levybacteria bacterium RIFCSPLOWO2_02_FULL_36_8b]